jgi:hypothetical protein
LDALAKQTFSRQRRWLTDETRELGRYQRVLRVGMLAIAVVGLHTTPAFADPSWELVRALSVARQLFDQAARLQYEDELHRPVRCGLSIGIRRVPDLTGDGRADLLVRLQWRVAVDAGTRRGSDGLHGCRPDASDDEYWNAEAVVLFDKGRRGRHRAREIVASTYTDGQTAARFDVGAVIESRSDGNRLELTTYRSDGTTGCELTEVQRVSFWNSARRIVSSVALAPDC